MSPDEIRETLLGHLGENRYKDFLRDFVSVARRKGRLTFWLEEALAKAGVPLTYEECLPIFTLCHVHRVPLVRRAVPVHRDVTRVPYSKDLSSATALRFPYSQQCILHGEFLGSAEAVEVDLCEQCLQEYQKYVAENCPQTLGLILTVEDAFQIAERGTVVTGILDIAWNEARIGDAIDLRTPGGRTIRTRIRELEQFRRTEHYRSAGILLGDNVSADQIPGGTRVIRVDEVSVQPGPEPYSAA